ncbi:MAG: putative Ig domain-containing protein [Cyclobacteriaceae bacterium]
MKKLFLRLTFLLLTISPFLASAQLDNVHYIPPMYGREDVATGNGEDIYLLLSTPQSDPFEVTITDGAGNSLYTGITIDRNNPRRLALSDATGASKGEGTPFLVNQSNLSTVQTDEGLILTANKAFFASIRVDEGAQAASLTSKGTAGFGTEFRSGHIWNVTGNPGSVDVRKAHIISFMATEDNTTVNVSDFGAVDFQNVSEGGGTITVDLDQGESYVLAAFANVAAANLNDVHGTRISSDKNIVVNSGSWLGGSPSDGNQQGRDIGIDQIASLEETGFEYILVKGQGTASENVIVVAAVDGTNIFLNGDTDPVNSTPLDAGDYYRLVASDYTANENMHLSSNQPVYVYQGLNGAISSNERQLGLNFIPPIVCLGGTNVDISEIDQLGNATIQIIAEAGEEVKIFHGTNFGTETDITANYSTVQGNSNYVTFKESGYTGDIRVVSPRPLRVALAVESNNVGAAGFFSGFTLAPVVESPVGYNAAVCIPDNLPVELTAAGFDSYQWYRDGIVLPGETNATINVESPGEYTAAGVLSGCQPSVQSFQLEIALCPGDVGIAKDVVSTTNVSGSIFDVVYDLVVTNYSSDNSSPNLQIIDDITDGLPSGATASVQVAPVIQSGSFVTGGVSSLYDGTSDLAMLQTSANGANTELAIGASVTIRFTVRVDMSMASTPAYQNQAIVSTSDTGPNDGINGTLTNQDFSDSGSDPDPNGNNDPTDSGENDVTQICLSNTTIKYDSPVYYTTGTDPTPTVIGLGGGSFEAPSSVTIDPTTGSIDLSASIVGTYTITYSYGGLCPTTTSVTIDLNPPSEPTVVSQIANTSLPTITGSAVLEAGETLTVSVDGETYTLGDGNLSISGTTWTLNIPTGNEITDGTYSVLAVIDDGMGGMTADLTANELVVDTDPPTVVIQNAPAIVSNTNTYVVTLQFSESIIGLDISDINTTNGTGANLVAIDGDTYTLEITPNGAGNIEISVPGSVVVDDAGNGNTLATPVTTIFDNTPPVAPTVTSLTTYEQSPTIMGTAEAGSSVTVVVGTATFEVTANSSGMWSVNTGDTPDMGTFTPTLDTPMEVQVTSTDAAGNSTVDTSNNELLIQTRPTITLGANPEICQGSTPANLTYSATTKSPDRYSIDFDDAANTAGFVDITDAVLPSSPIQIVVPGGATPAIYNASISVKLNADNSESTPQDITVTVKAVPTISVTSTTNPTSCSGNGSIELGFTNVPDGTYTITYATGSFTGVTISSNSATIVAPAGNYNDLEITINGCTSTNDPDAALTDPVAPTIAHSSSNNPTNCEGSNGSIVLSGLAASTTYTIDYSDDGSASSATAMSNGSGLLTLGGLNAGSYTNISVTGSNCTTNNLAGPFTLTDPTPVTIATGTITDPSTCPGTNGSIQLTGLANSTTYTVDYNYNGTPVNTSIMSDGSGNLLIGTLDDGNYTDISVTANNCDSNTITGPVVLDDPGSPSITFDSKNDPSTCLATDGDIQISGLGNMVTYDINYDFNGTAVGTRSIQSNGSGVLLIDMLSAGSYTNITATLAGCVSNPIANVVLNPPNINFGTNTGPTTCSGSEGIIELVGLDFNQSYTVDYTDDGTPTSASIMSNGSGSLFITGLDAGTYTNISVTLGLCTSNVLGSATLTDPAVPTMSQGTVTDPTSCLGSEGSIQLTGLDASTLYTVNYNDDGNPVSVNLASNGDGNLVISDLNAGTYTNINVTASNNCTSASIASIVLNDPTAPTIAQGTVTNESTCGDMDGSIQITGLANSTTYTLNYTDDGNAVSTSITSDGSGNALIDNLDAGAYTNISLTASNCTTNAITGPINITCDVESTYTIEAAQNIDTYADNDVLGNVTDPDGGGVTNAVLANSTTLPPGVALNSTTGQITVSDASLLVANTYMFDVTTTDGNGGTTTQTVTIVIDPDTESVYALDATQNVDSYVDNEQIASVTDAEGDITSAVISSGTLPPGTTLNATTGQITVSDADALVAGTTMVDITTTDETGGLTTQTVTIVIDPDSESTYTVSAAQNIETYSNGQSLATVADTDGTGVTSATLANGSTLPSGMTLNASTGEITVSDANDLVAGTYDFDITTTDSDGGVSTQTVTIVIDPDNEADYTVTPSMNIDTYSDNDVLASVTDDDGNITNAVLANGTMLPMGVALDPTTGEVTVTDASQLAAGTYTFDVTTTDSTGGTTTTTISFTIFPDAESVYSVQAAQNVDSYVNNETLATVTDSNGIGVADAVLANGTSLPAGVQLDPVTGEVFVSDAAQLVANTYMFDVTTTDSQGGTTTQTVTIVINPDSEATYTVEAAQNIDTYVDNEVLASVADTDGTGVTSAVLANSTTLPAGMALNATTGQVTVSDASLLTAGSHSFDITTTDSTGGVTTQTVTIVINADNEATYTVEAAQNIDTYVDNEVLTSVADTDGTGVTSAVLANSTTLPPGMALNASTGQVTVSDASLLTAGSHSFDVTTTDSTGGVTTQTVTIVINADNEATYTVEAAQNIDTYVDNEVLASVADTDGSGVTSAVLANSTTLPAGMALNASTGQVTVSNASLLTAGSHSFDVTTTDSTGGVTTQTVTIVINPDNEATYTVEAAQNIDTYVDNEVLATITDSDGTGVTSAVLANSTTLPAGVALNASTGEITVSDASQLTPGSHTFDVTTTDSTGGITTQTVTIVIDPDNEAVYSVNAPLPTDSYSDGETVASVSDADGAITSATVTNGTLPPGTVIDPVTGLITVDDETALVAGVYNFEVTTIDADGGETVHSLTVEFTAPGTDIEAIYDVEAAQPVDSYSDGNTLATVSDADGAITNAVLASGTLPPGTSLDPVTGEITVTDASALVDGSYTFDITTTDVNGETTTQTVTIDLNPAGSDIEAVYTSNDPRATDTYSNGESVATVTDGDGAITNAVVSSGSLPAGMVIDPVTGEITVADATQLVQGSYTFDVTTTDVNGETTVNTITIDLLAPGTDTEAIYSINDPITIDNHTNGTSLGTVSDIDGALTSAVVTAGSLPPGVSIDPVTGEFTTSDVTQLAPGSYTFDVTTTDADGGMTVHSVTLVILPIAGDDDDNDGITNSDEDIDNDGNPHNDDTDGDGIPNFMDTDDDGDGIPTEDEDINNDDDPTNDDTDGDNIPNYLDTDDDGDGVPTEEEDINNDNDPTNDDTDGDNIPNYLDTDDDGDGVPTADEDINNDDDPSNDDTDGDNIPNYLDTDDDGDGVPTADEDVNNDDDPTNDDTDGDNIPNYLDPDDDGDGVPTADEDVNNDDDPSNDDTDGDDIPNYLDTDDDGDGVPTTDEDVNNDDDLTNDDTDEDDIPNYLDPDDDGDGVNTADEDINNDNDPTNDDTDGDDIPDYLDPDDDGDGVPSVDEDINNDGDPTNDDSDGDDIPNYLDTDDDNDGIPTVDEDANGDGDPTNDDCDGDDVPNYLDINPCPGVDTDGDGVDDIDEDLDGDGDPTNDDTDGDGIPNHLDTDDDGDGIPTSEEDVNNDGDPSNDDCDNNGTPDYLDANPCPVNNDTDGDGVSDEDEDLDGDGDPTNDDSDGDGIPNFEDTDDDGDGIPTSEEDDNNDGDPTNDDCDNDGTPNYLDTDVCLADSDGDGIPDAVEDTDGDGDPTNDDADGDGIPNFEDTDSDGDGIPDAEEAGDDPANPVDTDNDGSPDYIDEDSDEDGIDDGEEAGDDPSNPVDTDFDGIPNYIDDDSDDDGKTDTDEGTDDCDGDGLANYIDANEEDCEDLMIPTGFSPDGDGINDFWMIPGIENFPNNTVKIYNRWGNLIFDTKGYDNQSNVWDSRSNGSLTIGTENLPDGTYFYVINLGEDGEKIRSGYVTIHRR